MLPRPFRASFLALMVLAGTTFLAAQEKIANPLLALKTPTTVSLKKIQESLPVLPRSIGVQFSALAAVDLEPRYRHLVDLIPEAIRRELAPLPARQLDEALRTHLVRWALEEVRRTQGKALATLTQDRDAARLVGTEARKLADLEQKLDAGREILEVLGRLGPDDLALPQDLAFVFPEALAELNVPLTGVVPDLGIGAGDLLKKGIWYRVAGTLSSSGNLVFLRLVLDSCLDGRRLVDREFSFMADEAFALPESIADALVQGLRSALPSGLRVSADVEGAEFELSPPVQGGSRGYWRFLDPGLYTVRIRARGHEPWEQEVLVEEGQVTRVSATLVKHEARTVMVDANVPAQVWMGAEYLGPTPWPLPLDGGRPLISVKADGYLPATVRLPDLTGGRLTFTLQSDLIGPDEELRSRRDDVYGALGLFVLSLGLPIVADGLYQADVMSFSMPGLDPAYQARLAQSGTGWYFLRNLGIGISGSLLVNTLFKIADYIAAADSLDHARPVHTEE